MVNKYVFIRAALYLIAACLFGIAVVFIRSEYVKWRNTEKNAVARVAYTQKSLRDSLDAAEGAQTENDILREKLLEQGYSEDAFDGFLASGAERAVQIKNIAGVLELYGTPWNLTLRVGDFTLVDLYYVGNRFILGQYEDVSGRSVWLHMSNSESYEDLTAGMIYATQNAFERFVQYLTDEGKLAGFSFWVLQDDGQSVTRYVATASFLLDMSTANEFLGSVIDGTIGKTGAEPSA
jgi:hypothetical protein